MTEHEPKIPPNSSDRSIYLYRLYLSLVIQGIQLEQRGVELQKTSDRIDDLIAIQKRRRK